MADVLYAPLGLAPRDTLAAICSATSRRISASRARPDCASSSERGAGRPPGVRGKYRAIGRWKSLFCSCNSGFGDLNSVAFRKFEDLEREF